MKTVSILLLSLTATIILPLSLSGVQATDQPDTNQTGSGDNNTITNIMGNSTENIGQEISDFVHNATAVFKQQRNETIQAIKNCHEQMKTATSDNRTQITDECHSTLDAIKEKYQDMRNQFQELFKQFRDSIITLKHHEEGLQVSDQDRDNAMKTINDDVAKHGMKGLTIKHGHVIEMRGNETNEYGNQSGIQHMPEESDHGMHGPPMSPGQSGSH